MPDGPRRRRAVSASVTPVATGPATLMSPATPSKMPREGRGHLDLPVPPGVPPKLAFHAEDELDADMCEPLSQLRVAGNARGQPR